MKQPVQPQPLVAERGCRGGLPVAGDGILGRGVRAFSRMPENADAAADLVSKS
jgi:hypothetical protein